MWHHDVTNARTCQFFRRLFDRLPVRISTSDLHHRILRKKLYHIRAYDFGVQFSCTPLSLSNRALLRFESESARRRHCLCSRDPGPLRRRSSFTGPSTTTGTRSNDGEGDDFFLPSMVFQVYDCYFTNVLTQRSCLGFLLTADSQCFTRNDARTFVPTIPRRRQWLGERSL